MSTQSVPVRAALEDDEMKPQLTVLYLPRSSDAYVLRPEAGRFTPEDFAAFCAENDDLRLEMTSEGEMIIMLPVGPTGSHRNAYLTARLINWADTDATGIAFDATAGFKLPNGAVRSPDASWVRLDRWEALTQKERESFSPLCPDFVVELRSRTDHLNKLQAKLEEYIANGAQLGWLIDPLKKQVHIYRPDTPVDILENPPEISGEPLLNGFVLKLAGILA